LCICTPEVQGHISPCQEDKTTHFVLGLL
jgi:hypothetical protein